MKIVPQTGIRIFEGAKVVPLAITVIVGGVLWLLPSPSGVDDRAWQLLAIFVATIVGFIVRPLPMGAVAVVGIVATVITGTLSIRQAVSGFGNHVIWLLVVAFMIARGFIKTGLSRRIAYGFVALLGKKSLGLGYGLVATDLVLAPAIPSNTARAGGVVFPILLSLAKSYESEPDDGTARKIGAFLTLTAFQGTGITSAMFLTAMAANPLAVELAHGLGVEVTWGDWAWAAIVPGLVSLVIVPLALYWLYPPEIKETPAAAETARAELAKMGRMKTSELIMFATFVLLLALWIFGRGFGLHPTAAALVGLATLLLTGERPNECLGGRLWPARDPGVGRAVGVLQPCPGCEASPPLREDRPPAWGRRGRSRAVS